jgi:hypothetical protein
MASPRFLHKWAGVGLIAGLAWTGSRALAAEPPARLPTVVQQLPATSATVLDSQKAAPAEAGQQPASTSTITADGYGAAPAAGTPAAAGGYGDGAASAPPSIWANVPPLRPFPRIGGFWIPPTGPGYYSLWDVLTDNYREGPPARPWPPYSLDIIPFFESDFRYLDNPNNTTFDYLDCVKRMHCGENWLWSIGGEERIRLANEVDSRLSGKNDNFQLLRSRLYSDLWYRDQFRFYIEGIDARSFNQDLPPLASDVNETDFLNLFVDVKLAALDDHPIYFRGGRQELWYGSQRLIHETEWPNAPRTFDGAKVFYRGDKWDVDGFWTRPVVIDPLRVDSNNDKAQFAGLWATYRPEKTRALDLYYLYYDDSTPLVAKAPPGTRGGFNVNTFGSRYYGDYNFLVWDFEGMYQCGEHTKEATSAGAATAGLGAHLADAPMDPTMWIYYDFASGDHNPGKDHFGTFNPLFPNGHAYFGWTDLVGRQNIQDLSFQSVLFPTKWWLFGTQYHILRLDSAKDALYNAAKMPIRADPTGRAGTDVGDVLTFWTNFHLGFHSDILLQYSHLYSGEFIKHTGSPLSPDFFYAQYTFRW